MYLSSVLLSRNGGLRSMPLRVSSLIPRTFTQVNSSTTFVKYRLQKSEALIIARNYMPPDFPKATIAGKFRSLDGIPQNYELIYRVHFPNYLIAVQVVNLLGILIIILTVITFLLPQNASNKISKESKSFVEVTESKIPIIPIEPPEHRLPTPHPSDMSETGSLKWDNLAVLWIAFLGIGIAINRLLRRIPIRLYTSSSGHSYAVFYGHIIPSMTTKREFVAGTVKKIRNSNALLSSDVLFEDGAGRKMILFDDSYRYPADMNYLLGIKKPRHDEDDSGNRKQ